MMNSICSTFFVDTIIYFNLGRFLFVLGEEPLSYGYGGTGKASTECNFKDYGESFTAGDVITAYVVRNVFVLIVTLNK